MNTFHLVFQKIATLIFALSFVFVATYVPQPVSKVQVAEAGFATAAHQQAQIAIAQTQLVADTTTAGATSWDYTKNDIFDALVWTISKMILAQLTNDIVNWINRGFEGSPTFVQNIGQSLLEISDVAIGVYLQELGGIASFVCAPFRIDIQIALNLSYQSALGYGIPRCSLTGALANIEGFFTGSGAFFEGGWQAWYGVTARPLTYTPYGEFMAAQGGAAIRLRNAHNQEMTLWGYGDGFRSNKICETVFSSGANRELCYVSGPGAVIEETLNFYLQSSGRALVVADEFNEIIGALFSQIAFQALNGTASLLGLSNDTGYTQPVTYDGVEYDNYADGQADHQYTEVIDINEVEIGRRISEALAAQEALLDKIPSYTEAIAKVDGLAVPGGNETTIEPAIDELKERSGEASTDLLTLEEDITTSMEDITDIAEEFNAIALDTLRIDPVAAQKEAIALTLELEKVASLTEAQETMSRLDSILLDAVQPFKSTYEDYLVAAIRHERLLTQEAVAFEVEGDTESAELAREEARIINEEIINGEEGIRAQIQRMESLPTIYREAGINGPAESICEFIDEIMPGLLSETEITEQISIWIGDDGG